MKTVPLGEVASIETRGTDPSQLDPTVPYLGLEHMQSGGDILRYSSVGEAAVASTKFRFTPDHVLFGKLRPNLGKIAIADREGVCSTDILPIAPGPELDKTYLKYCLRQPHMIAYAASRAAGANLPRLNPAQLKHIEIPLPEVEEQRRIAAILDKADALRAKRRQALAHLDSLTQSIFHESFQAEGETVSLGDLIVDGPTNGLYLPQSMYGSGVPILRIDAFDDGFVHERDLKRVGARDVDIAKYGLRVDDIVINRVNSMPQLGKSALVRRLEEPTTFESNMMRVRLDGSRVLPEFASAWLQTPSARRQIRAKGKQAINQASINQGDVRSLVMPLPTLAEQERFIRRVFKAREIRGDQQLAGLDSLFSSLQSRAFRGEL